MGRHRVGRLPRRLLAVLIILGALVGLIAPAGAQSEDYTAQVQDDNPEWLVAPPRAFDVEEHGGAISIAATPDQSSTVVATAEGCYWRLGDDLQNIECPMRPFLRDAEQVMAVTAPDAETVCLITDRGQVREFGGTGCPEGSVDFTLNEPIIGVSMHPSGDGFWLVASDGGVFAFGAPFFGSMGGQPLAEPVVGMAPTSTGEGYWLVAADGGIFAFGDATFNGSMGGLTLNQPMTTMIGFGVNKYITFALDGGVFVFTEKSVGYCGSLGSVGQASPVIASVVFTAADGSTVLGYMLLEINGTLWGFCEGFSSDVASGLGVVIPIENGSGDLRGLMRRIA